jgi:hypothetical protein
MAIPQLLQSDPALDLLQAEDIRPSRRSHGPGHGGELALIQLFRPLVTAVLRILPTVIAIVEEVLYVIAEDNDTASAGQQKQRYE